MQKDNPNNNSFKDKSIVKENLLVLFKYVTSTLNDLFNLREGAEVESTIESIKRDIVFKGHNVWILIFSIFIASIGLNLNSTAVIIGAMLISPLMGPILGVGLAVGTNDWPLLKKSARNFATAVIIAIATSYTYFQISPLAEAQSELLARTKPHFLDALIAMFGGLSGIIAGSRKEKSNVIPGVAIATALMPPLCTAGYGLAIGNFEYFFGAFYLFMLNSVFISITTLLVVRYLKFPMVEFVDARREKRVRWTIISLTVIILIPSTILFWQVIQESVFKSKAQRFVVENFDFQGTEILSQKFVKTDSISVIDLFLVGTPLSDEIIKDLNRRLLLYDLKDTRLKIHQSNNLSEDMAGRLSKDLRADLLEDLFSKNISTMEEKEKEIMALKDQLIEAQKDNLLFDDIEKEIRVIFKDVVLFSLARMKESNFKSGRKEYLTVLVRWKSNMSVNDKQKRKAELLEWLSVKFPKDKPRVIEY